MPWGSTLSQTSCAPLGFPHRPWRLPCRRHPEALWGPPAFQTRWKRNALPGLERWGREPERFKSIGAARVRAVRAHPCPDTRTPTHTRSCFQLPSRPSCLNFPLFPRRSPDLWHGGASHGAAAPAAERSGKEPHTNLCQLRSPFLAPRFEIY